MFRGREVTHPERGTMILDRLAEELAEIGVVEQRPMQEGRNMTMMMAPSKAVLAGTVGEETHGDGGGGAPVTMAGTPAENGAAAKESASEATPAAPPSGSAVANGAAAVEAEPVAVDGADAPSPEPQA
jgi:translation initiation factor IF-3